MRTFQTALFRSLAHRVWLPAAMAVAFLCSAQLTAASAAAPVITSIGAADGCLGSPFTYTILATNTPLTFTATGLPNGLNIGLNSGLISGTPAANGQFRVALSATNASGTGTKLLVLTVNLPAGNSPIITSISQASGTVGVAMLFSVIAIRNPASFTASGMPPGLTINSSTGIITGTPTLAGTYNISISAINIFGANATTVTMVIASGSSTTTTTTTGSGSASATGTGSTTGSSSSSATGTTTTTTTGGTGQLAGPESTSGKSCGLGGSLGALLFAGLLLHVRNRRSI